MLGENLQLINKKYLSVLIVIGNMEQNKLLKITKTRTIGEE